MRLALAGKRFPLDRGGILFAVDDHGAAGAAPGVSRGLVSWGNTMALGRKRQEQQQSIWIDAQALPEHDAHPFYQKLNDIFKSERIDAQLEALAAPYYDAKMGRPGLVPGVYVRMTLLGYFENLPSDRRIAWQANDSLSLRVFLDLALTEKAPCHNVLSTTRRRLPLEWHQAVHQLVIGVLAKHGLVKGDTLGLDASTMEANASLRALVRT